MKIITSSDNPLVKHLVKLRTQRRYRETHQTALIEGKTMVEEALSHASVKRIFLVEGQAVEIGPSCEMVLLSQKVMEKICGTKTPEGIAAEVDIPHNTSLEGLSYVVALDQVNDPGNMGTILRTALALDWEGIFLLEGCCDPYNDKALRAAKGATFRLPIGSGSWEDLNALIEKEQWQPVAADMSGMPAKQLGNTPKRLLILGSETHGLSSEAKAASTLVTIPIRHIDSLNVAVAGGILMTQLRQEDLDV